MSANKPELCPIRTVVKGDTIYIHQNDVAELIRGMAGSEETDVRNRFNQLAANLMNLQPIAGRR